MPLGRRMMPAVLFFTLALFLALHPLQAQAG